MRPDGYTHLKSKAQIYITLHETVTALALNLHCFLIEGVYVMVTVDIYEAAAVLHKQLNRCGRTYGKKGLGISL